MTFPVLSLEEAQAQADAAYEAKGLAADALKRSRTAFNAASRALAQAEAALLAAERRSLDAA